MSQSEIKLVCFDIGGVMIRICRTWEEGCLQAELPIRDGVRQRLDHQTEARHDLINQFQTGKIQGPEYFQRVSDLLDGLYTPEEIAAVHNAWILEPYEGLIDVIDSIHQAGLLTAALSNINPIHWDRMSQYPAVMALGRRFASHEIGHHKPNEAIYQAFEQGVNLTGSQILFFDDLQKNIDAASSRGWIAVQIDHEKPTATQIEQALCDFGVIETKIKG